MIGSPICRVLCLGAAAVFAVPAAAQDASYESLFSTVRPDVMVRISEHPSGAENVEITTLAAGYPQDLLRQQCEAVGTYVGTPVRGLMVAVSLVDPQNESLNFVKARFATNGLIDREEGVLRVEPILKAFAGAPAPYTVTGLAVVFDGERPSEHTVRTMNLPGKVQGEGRFSVEPVGVEYRIRIVSQNPDDLRFPERAGSEATRPSPAKPRGDAPLGTAFWVAFGVAGAAIVALVYLALLRISPRRRGT